MYIPGPGWVDPNSAQGRQGITEYQACERQRDVETGRVPAYGQAYRSQGRRSYGNGYNGYGNAYGYGYGNGYGNGRGWGRGRHRGNFGDTARIDQLEASVQAKITSAISGGLLRPWEARRLQFQLSSIVRQEANLKASGGLSFDEAATLDRRLDDLNARVDSQIRTRQTAGRDYYWR